MRNYIGHTGAIWGLDISLDLRIPIRPPTQRLTAKHYDGSVGQQTLRRQQNTTAGSPKHLVFQAKIHRKSPQIATRITTVIVNCYAVVFLVRQGPLRCDVEKSAEKLRFLFHVQTSGPRLNPRPQRLTIFHLILGGRSESLLRKPGFP